MRGKLSALLCAVMLAMCGCTVNGVPVEQGPDIPERLLEELPVEVDLDGITFRAPAAEGLWGEPREYEDSRSVSVWWNGDSPGWAKEDSLVFQLMWRGSGTNMLELEDLGTDLSDADYVNAGVDYFERLEAKNADSGLVCDYSDWEVRRDPGGVVCTCFLGEYNDPRVTHQASWMLTGYMGFVYTNEGPYSFEASYRHYPGAEDHSVEMLPIMMDVTDTLYAGPSA